MKLSEIMTKNVEVLPQNATVRDAAKLMKDINVGAIPVIVDKQMVGIITDRDIVVRSTAEGRNPNETTIQDVMTSEIYFCYEDQDVKDGTKVMSKHQVRRLPIINRKNELVGIVSLGDISVDASNDEISGQTLEDISRPARPSL